MSSLVIIIFCLVSGFAHAQVEEDDVREFIPNSPGSHEALRAFDQAYREQTGEDTMFDFTTGASQLWHLAHGDCYRQSCRIFVNVVKGESPQRLYIFLDGEYKGSWLVSTARSPYVTPNFDGHPSGPFYSGYFNSKKYPGGDYMGLGNMPYAVFYSGDFAIHGTGAIRSLGRPASHGCVRSPPVYAQYFSKIVREHGADEVWVTVSQRRVAVILEPRH